MSARTSLLCASGLLLGSVALVFACSRWLDPPGRESSSGPVRRVEDDGLVCEILRVSRRGRRLRVDYRHSWLTQEPTSYIGGSIDGPPFEVYWLDAGRNPLPHELEDRPDGAYFSREFVLGEVKHEDKCLEAVIPSGAKYFELREWNVAERLGPFAVPD